MDYKIAAIDTTYKGIRFRSRLEARWAAFFSQLGWEWTYEPFELSGWMPDFLIRGKSQDILVEVKPVTSRPDDVAAKLVAAIPSEPQHLSPCICDADRIETIDMCIRDHPAYSALIVGVSPVSIDDWRYSIGWLRDDDSCGWEDAILGCFGDAPPLGYCGDMGSFRDRITDRYTGNFGGEPAASKGEAAWAEACNVTRWNAAEQKPRRQWTPPGGWIEGECAECGAEASLPFDGALCWSCYRA